MTDLFYTADAFDQYLRTLNGAPLYLLADAKSNGFCVPVIRKMHPALRDAKLIVVPDGDHNKTIAAAEWVWQELWRTQADKKSLLLNIGGGMICDLGGFVASIYKRGIPFVQVPTTLLGMVDASIGGKCGLNFQQTKNCLGVFNDPQSVYINPVFLNTLPDRILKSGIAEMMKHALLQGEEIFQQYLQQDTAYFYTAECIQRSIRFKSKIVQQDKQDEHVRQTLNLGHSIGHAIESFSHTTAYSLLHGEAVMTGLLVEMMLSHIKFGMPLDTISQLLRFQQKIFPQLAFSCTFAQLEKFLINDKKNNGGYRMSLLQNPGDCRWQVPVEPHEIELALQTLRSLIKDMANCDE